MTPWSDPPRWFVRTSGAAVLVGLAITVVGAIRIGVTVDETFHVMRLQNFLDAGWYLLDDDLRNGAPGAWVDDTYVYGPVTALILHLASVLTGVEAWDSVSFTSDAYIVRHLAVALLGAGTLGACAALTRSVSGSWRWGLVGSAVLSVLPMWSGHAMFNVKDVPVAAGYTFVTLGCILLVRSDRGDTLRRLGVSALLWAGVVLAVGTRPAIWPGLAAALGAITIASLAGRRSEREWWRVWNVGLVVVAAGSALSIVYPAVFLHPAHWLLGATSESANYRGGRSAGYIPLAIVGTVPVVLLLFGVFGSAARLAGAAARRPTLSLRRDLPMLLVVLQALLLPAILMVQMPSLNGGLRHLLFAAPAVSVLIAAGIAQIVDDMPGGRSRVAVALTATFGLALPLAAQVQLMPLGYAYANPVSDAAGAGLPADFWQASFRDLADELPDAMFVVCGALLDDQDRPLRRMPYGGQSPLALSDDCRTSGSLSVLQPFLSTQSTELDAVDDEFVALIVDDDPDPVGCRELARVTKLRLATHVVASRALLCPLVLPLYERPFDVDAAGRGEEYLLGGWSGDGGATFATVDGRASLGFEVNDLRDLTLSLTGSAGGHVEFLVNNVPTPSRRVAGSWHLRPELPLQHLGGSGNVVVTIVAEDGSAHIDKVRVAGGRR